MTEATIVVNGVEISPAQSMVVRVALIELYERTSDPDMLGTDEEGREITRGYRSQAGSVLRTIMRTNEKTAPVSRGGRHVSSDVG